MIRKLENEISEAYPDGLTWQKTIPTFHPENTEQAADIFSRAGRHGQKLFISGFNNVIDPVGDEFTDLLVIKSDRLNYIDKIAAGDFYITVGAGYPLIQINQAVSRHNLWFPFSTVNYPGSVGGALACGLAARGGQEVYPFDRYLMSVTAVLPDGSVVRPGAKTFKSVSGYDISRLFYNSWGTVGMVTELTLRLLPQSRREELPHLAMIPPDRAAFVRRMQGDDPAAGVFRKIKAEFDPGTLLPTA